MLDRLGGFRRATDRAFCSAKFVNEPPTLKIRVIRERSGRREEAPLPGYGTNHPCHPNIIMPDELYSEDEEERHENDASPAESAQDVPLAQEGVGEQMLEVEAESEKSASASSALTVGSACGITEHETSEDDNEDDFVEVSPAASSSPAPGPEPHIHAMQSEPKSKDICKDIVQPAGSSSSGGKSGDLLENVAKRLLGHPDHHQQHQQQQTTKSPQRGSDFLQQVKKDFADASGDIATSASALRASIQSSLQASPRVVAAKKEGRDRCDDGGDKVLEEEIKTKSADANIGITSSTRFGGHTLPSLATNSATKSAAAPAKAPIVDTKESTSAPTSSTAPVPAAKSTISKVIKPTLKVSQSTEHAHSFHEHTYKQPTYCGICNGLLVGLWSQGFKCELCDMNVHRGGGAGDHDDCRAEALLAPCPGPDHAATEIKEKKAKESAKLSDVVSQIRALAEKENFIKELSEQVDKDLRARAKEAIVEVAVDDERNKNLRRLKEGLVPFVAKLDACVAKGELYVFIVLMTVLSLATIIQTIISFGLFLIALGPRHGFLSITSFQLAAMHDATVTAALHTVLAIVSAVAFHLACLFKRKQNLIDRFLLDALRITASTDIGISVADAAQRLMSWSKRLLVSTSLSMLVSFFFWHQAQPVSWAAAKLPPTANILIPSFVFTLCAGAVSYFSYANAPPDIALEGYVDVKSEMIRDEIEIAASKHADSELMEKAEKTAFEPNLVEGRPESDSNHNEESKAVNDAELHDLLDGLVPSGAIIE